MEENNPDILYHYCSADTFYEIIKSKSLRLSDITKSNDSQELKWVFTSFKKDFTLSYMKKYGQTGTDERFEKVMEYADGIFQKSYARASGKEKNLTIMDAAHLGGVQSNTVVSLACIDGIIHVYTRY